MKLVSPLVDYFLSSLQIDHSVTGIRQANNLVMFVGVIGIIYLIIILNPWNFVGLSMLLREINKDRLEEVENKLLPSSTILAEKLITHFDRGELEILCFELKIDYDEIGGDAKSLKVIKLIRYCERRGQIQELIERARRHRPHVAWP